MARCRRLPQIRNLDIPAAPLTATIELDRDTVAFVLRCRTPVGVTLAIEGNPLDVFSLAAGETYSEEGMKLDAALRLVVSAASAVIMEVWLWDV